MASGLDALLGFGDEPEGEGVGGASGLDAGRPHDGLISVPVASVQPNPYQPRRSFDDAELDDLAASIRSIGVLQPIIVRRLEAGRYELVAGERRWRAAQRAGLRVVPAIVRALDDQGSLEQAIVENLHRADLNVLEEAAGYRQLMDEFALTQGEVAERVGKSRSAVANTVRLLALPASVQALVRRGQLSGGHVRSLVAIDDPEVQVALAHRAAQDGLTVRELERLARSEGRSPKAGGGSGATLADGKPSGSLEIEVALSERLDTRVSASTSSGRGRLVIEFADLADLERIYLLLMGEGAGPEGPGAHDDRWP